MRSFHIGSQVRNWPRAWAVALAPCFTGSAFRGARVASARSSGARGKTLSLAWVEPTRVCGYRLGAAVLVQFEASAAGNPRG
jgi:hypothetical protein